MLRTSSYVTKACGQGHYKKFWLMQTQIESPDQSIGVSSASVLSFPATLLKGSDGKVSCIPASRSFATELLPQGRAAWSTVGSLDAGFGGISNVQRTNVSLSTCAESLTHQQFDESNYLFHLPCEGCLSADGMNVNDNSLDVEPRRSSGPCGSHSPCVSSSPTLFGLTDQLSNDSTSRETGFSGSASPSVCTSSGKGSFQASRSGNPVRDCEVVTVSIRDAAEENTCSTGSESCVRREPFSKDSAQENVFKSANDSPCRPSGRPPEYSNTVFAQDFTEVDGLHGDDATHTGCRPVLIEQREEHVVESAGVCAGRNVLRMCKSCGTTKTPLWRSGPQGPKSLCNACGIRFKKLKKSQGAGEYSYLEASPLSSTKFAARSLKRKSASEKDVESVKGRSRRLFKKSAWAPPKFARRNTFQIVDDTESCLTSPGRTQRRRVSHMLKVNSERKEFDAKLALLQNESGLTNVFTSDVKEAAILLMALSCGLVLA